MNSAVKEGAAYQQTLQSGRTCASWSCSNSETPQRSVTLGVEYSEWKEVEVDGKEAKNTEV